MPVVDAASDLALMAGVAREAGELSIERLKRGVHAWEKSPGQVVTDVDIELNRLIRSRLNQSRADYGWLSEEEERSGPPDLSQPTFLVDPIDGTRALIRGETGFCVSLALIFGGETLAGVLFNPMTGEMFTGLAGSGAHLNGNRIRTSEACEVDTCLIVGQSRVFRNTLRWPLVRHLDPMPNSIAYRIALVAAGSCDAAVALGDKADWDLAAATLILSEAGGCACDRMGRSFRYGGADPRLAGVVAAGANLHPLILDAVLNAVAPA